MKIVKQIFIVFFLVIFLFGTTGISMVHHICTHSHHDDLSVYPELFKDSGTSCCGEEEDGSAGNDQNITAGSPGLLSISAIPCCLRVHSFLKLAINPEVTKTLVVNPSVEKNPLFSISSTTLTAIKDLTVPAVFFEFYSPPLYGKRLIHFLHQPKIPSHPSFA